jgi:hypothetical protein
MTLFGSKQNYRAVITEPKPGRVLVETYLDPHGAVTTFIVDPGPTESQSHVTITTKLPVRSGIPGAIERYLSTRLLRPIYTRELALLGKFLSSSPPAARAKDSTRGHS